MAESDEVILVKNLTKKYKLYDRPIDRLKEALHPFRKIYHRDFTALDNVSIEIKRGQTVGIIGKNGSGKSTFLKILTGVLSATSGEVKVDGKIAALLELGAGFNPELTGLENIFLNGSLMGYSQAEMTGKVDAIVDFADIGEFINQPVKLYSSGMFARLAFAVAINVDPDILIVDEALSVGDIFFQAKCYAYFEKLQAKGKTVLFVTHSLETVARNCNFAFCLVDGQIASRGEPGQVIDAYKKIQTQKVVVSGPLGFQTKQLSSAYKINPAADAYGSKQIVIEDFGVLNEHGLAGHSFYQGDKVEFVMTPKLLEPVKDFIAAFALRTIDGVEVLGTNTAIERISVFDLIRAGSGQIKFKCPLDIQEGEYLLSFGLTYFDPNGDLKVYHRLYNILSIVINKRHAGTGMYSPKIETIVVAGLNEWRD